MVEVVAVAEVGVGLSSAVMCLRVAAERRETSSCVLIDVGFALLRE